MKFGKFIIFLAVAAIATLLSGHGNLFALTRSEVAAGEAWRLITGHFVHFSGNHLIMNLGMLAVLLHLLPRVSRSEVFWLGFITPLAISVSLLFTRPHLEMYGGLSGWISGLFVFVALVQAAERIWMRYLYAASLAMFVLKVFIEFSTGGSVFISLGKGAVVESAAHVIGTATGIFGVLIGSRPQAGKGTGGYGLSVENKKAVPEGTA